MAGPDTFPSYRLDIFVESISVDDSGATVSEFVDIQAAANDEPFAQQISIYMDTIDETADVEVVQLDDTIYMWSAGGWMCCRSQGRRLSERG